MPSGSLMVHRAAPDGRPWDALWTMDFEAQTAAHDNGTVYGVEMATREPERERNLCRLKLLACPLTREPWSEREIYFQALELWIIFPLFRRQEQRPTA